MSARGNALVVLHKSLVIVVRNTSNRRESPTRAALIVRPVPEDYECQIIDTPIGDGADDGQISPDGGG